VSLRGRLRNRGSQGTGRGGQRRQAEIVHDEGFHGCSYAITMPRNIEIKARIDSVDALIPLDLQSRV
jgi:hypothetical protein